MTSLAAWQREFLARLRSFIPIAEEGGVPGSVMIGQAVLESGWGRSGLAHLGSALFGIKARDNWTGNVYSGTTKEFAGGRYVTIHGPNRLYPSRGEALADGCDPRTLFRAYESVPGNLRDYIEFFHRNARYDPALRLFARTRDPRIFVVEIARAGYATAPDYAERLIALMEWLAPDLLPVPRLWTVRVNGSHLRGNSVRIDRGRVFVHVRSLAAALGLRVEYEPQTRTVSLHEEAVR